MSLFPRNLFSTAIVGVVLLVSISATSADTEQAQQRESRCRENPLATGCIDPEKIRYFPGPSIDPISREPLSEEDKARYRERRREAFRRGELP